MGSSGCSCSEDRHQWMAGRGGPQWVGSSQLVSAWMRCHSVSSVRRVPSELMMVNHHFDLVFRGLRDFLTVS